MIWYIFAPIIALLAVILVRAAAFSPKRKAVADTPGADFDREKAVDSLAGLVKCKTVSCNDPAQEDEAEFSKFIALLPQLYPHVFETCRVQHFPDRALLLHWQGSSEKEPTVLMAHYDVVAAEEEKWHHPPFGAVIEYGILWGRGTLDTKVTVNAILSAADALIAGGYMPKNDIYFAFSGGEEVNGSGARNIVQHFQAQGITPALVLDEGGAVVENVFPGVKESCAMVGIAEKGMINAQYTALSQGGHASAPTAPTPVEALANACCRVKAKPFPMHITPPAKKMFDTLGRHSTFGYKVIFANLWLFSPLLNLICRRSGGELNALVRTTTAFTQASGSQSRNVIPGQASLVSNMRLNPADSVESALAHLKKAVNDPTITITALESFAPSPISQTDCPAWNKVAAVIQNTWPGCIVSPYLMVQCSDARHWGALSDHVYRFSAIDLTSAERKTIHGHNEGIRLETVQKAVEFYIRLMKLC